MHVRLCKFFVAFSRCLLRNIYVHVHIIIHTARLTLIKESWWAWAQKTRILLQFLREDPTYISPHIPTTNLWNFFYRLTRCRSIYWYCLLIFKLWPWYRSHHREETHFLYVCHGLPLLCPYYTKLYRGRSHTPSSLSFPFSFSSYSFL